MAEFTIPTEQVTLPSKGLLYPKESPLSKGEIEMKYMTAKHEDILTNANYIRQGIVIDKLLQSMIVTPIDYNELLNGDKNAILIAARILGYGKDYDFFFTDPNTGIQEKATIDLTTIDTLPLNESLYTPGKNEFTISLPVSKIVVTFKLLIHGDENKIEKEIEGMKKINPQSTTTVTTRLKHMITSVSGDREIATIREFADNMLARDVRALREFISKITPDLNLKVTVSHDCVIGDFVEVSPGVNIAGNCNIGNGVNIGTNATVIPKITIGVNSIIAAGAVVTKNVPPNVMVAGVPAVIKKVEAIELSV